MKKLVKNLNSFGRISTTLGILLISTVSMVSRASDLPEPSMDQTLFYGTDAIAVSDTLLDEIRGGFISSNGVLISFGIERVTYINGVLNSSTSFNLPPNIFSANSAAKPPVIPENGSIVQAGSSNINKSFAARSTFQGTVIQNSLDNQSIRATTTINAITNTSQVMKSLNFSSMLRDALGAAIGGR